MHGAYWDNVVCILFSGAILVIGRGSEIPFVHGQMKTLNASMQAIKLTPRYSGQAHFKGPSIGPRNEHTEYGCAFGLLRL